VYRTIEKVIKLICAGLGSLAISINFHYLASFLNNNYLKALVYGGLIIFGIFLIVFDDVFNQYLELKTKGIMAIILISCFSFFIGGAYRATLLNEPIEAIILLLIPSVLAFILLTVYIKILIVSISNKENV
jgi:hypothetical protein